MKIHLTSRWLGFAAGILAFTIGLGLPPSVRAGAASQIALNIQLQQIQSPGNALSYGIGLNLTTTVSPITYDEVIAPAGAFTTAVGANAPYGFGTSYNDLGSLLNETTNGLWTLILNAGDPSASTNYFTVSLSPDATNNFGPLTILYPANDSVGIPNTPTFSWTGPTNEADLSVQAHDSSYNVYESADLPVVTTSWASSQTLNDGFNFFQVTYTNASDGEVVISTPTNASGQPVSGWVGTADFEVQNSVDFFVGALPGLVAHYTFDNPSYLSQDSSGNGFDLQGPSWFGQPPAASSSGFGGGSLQFFGSGWYNLPPVILAALSSNFTVSVWLQTTNMVGNDDDSGYGGAGVLWADNDNGQSNCVPMTLTGSKEAFYTGDTFDTLHSASDVTTGQWVHLVVSRDIATGQKDIYINGVLDSSDTAGTAALTDSSSILLGYNFDGAGYTGLLDDLQIYSVVLSAEEVSFLYQNPESAITNAISLGEALAAPSLTWTTSGDATWFGETTNTYDGQAAAESGPITNSQTSILQTTITGPATISFEWQTSPNGNNFDCEFSVDGSDAADIGPDTYWTSETYSVGVGQHTLTWTAMANGDTDPTEAAYVGDVVYVPTGSASGGHTLVAHYTFDDPNNVGADSSGNNLYFNSGGGQDGGSVVPTNDAAAGTGALFFTRDLSNPYCAAYQGWYPTTPSQILSALTGSFTVAAWVKTTASVGNQGDLAYNGSAVLAADVSGVANDTIPIALTGGQVAFNTGNTAQNRDDTLNSTRLVNDGTYHQIVVTRDQSNGSKEIYIDGTLDATGSGTTALLNDPKIVVIGAITDASDPTLAGSAFYGGFDGEMDDLQIYAGVLDAAEVSALFSAPGSAAPNVTGGTSISSNGLVARYTFDNSANLGQDASGNGYDLTYNGNPSGGGVVQNSTAKVGTGAAYFDGGSFLSYVAMPSTVLQTFSSNFTLSFWINTTQTYGNPGDYAYSGAGIVAADVPGLANDIIPAALTGGEIAFNTGGSSDDTLSSSADVNDGQYHHVAITRNQLTGEKDIYIDGQFDNADTATTNLLNSPVLVAVGCNIDASNPNPASASPSGFFQGLLDDIQIYDRVLSPSDVSYLYNNPGQEAAVPPDFNVALNTTNLDWSTYGNAPWFEETTNTHDGVMAAQSGAISNYGISVLSVDVTGPSTLSFWWKTTNDDNLEFFLDNNYVQNLYGNQPWTEAGPFVLTPGPHLLYWLSEDAFGNAYSGTIGYLDQVTFSNVYPPQITEQPANQTLQAGSNLVLTAQILSSPPAALQWLYNGAAIAGATNETLVISNAQPSNSGNYQLTATNSLGFANTYVVSVLVYVPSDLEAVSLSAPAVVGSQTYVPIVWTGSNAGPGEVTTSFLDTVYVETNNQIVALYYLGHSAPVPAGASYTATNNIVLGALPAGNYTLAVQIDSFKSVPGNSGSNNYITNIPLTVVNPDLQPTSLAISGATEGGQSLHVNYTEVNNGPGAIQLSWYDKFYLSASSVLDSNAVYVGEWANYPGSLGLPTNITAGTSFTNLGVQLTLPVVPSGNYYLIVVANANNSLKESVTNNNQLATPFVLTLPDLVPTSLNVPSVVSSREPVRLSWTVANEGNGPAQNPAVGALYQWYDNIYLSTNEQVNAGSVLLGSVSDGSYYGQSFPWSTPLPPGQSITNIQNVEIPNVVAGNYYLVLDVDALNFVPESNESNNVLAVPVTLSTLDLQPTAFSAPPAANSRSTIQLTWTVTNNGAGIVYPQWVDSVYISPDPTLDAQAVLLSSVTLSNQLDAGTNYTVTNLATLPGVAGGNYYLILYVNALTNVTETSQANNFLVQPITIGTPDLAAQSLVVPTNIGSQELITPVYSVENISGVVALPGWGDEFYLSPDPVLDSNAIPLVTYDYFGNAIYDYFWNEPVNVGQSYTNLAVNLPIPSTTNGNYYILLNADANHFFDEPNFANNVIAQPVHLANADLTPTNLNAPAFISETNAGQTFEADWTVVNEGQGTAYASWTDDLYFSPTNVLDSNAVYLGSFGEQPGLQPGEAYVGSVDTTLPVGPRGNYYFIVQVNANQTLYESSLTNNIIVKPVQVSVPPYPVLSVLNVQAPASAWSGQQIQVTWTLTNSGTAAVNGTFSDAVFLTTSSTGANPQFYNSFQFTGEIPAGQSVTREQLVSLPISLSGTYWVGVETDAGQEIFEYTNDNQNIVVASQPTVVYLTPTPNLEVTNIQAPTSLFSGDQALVSWVVTNAGTGPTSSSYWNDAVYLSNTNNLTNATYLRSLGSVPNAAYLSAGQSYASSETITIPQGIDGTYYFVVRADDGNTVFEGTNAGNNVAASAPVFIQLTSTPDLQVASVIPPLNAFSGQPTSVTWSVTNYGQAQTGASLWYDDVYLSTNTVYDFNAYYLGSFPHVGALVPDQGYTTNTSVTLPVGISGNWYFIIFTDSKNQVYEGAFEDNNFTTASTPTLVALTPPPDLQTVILSSPTTALASHSLSVTYAVTNNGSTATPNSSWSDGIYLSTNANFNDPSTYLFAQSGHSGILQPGQGYVNTITQTLPDGYSGTFYVFVEADIYDQVFELNKSNNLAMAPVPVVISSEPADLAVTSAAAPSSANSGGSILVSWAVTNQGTGDTAVSQWDDRVILSENSVLGSPSDMDIADFEHYGLLAPGGEYSVVDQTVQIPNGLTPGLYYLFIDTDAHNDVYEGTNEDNNTYGPLPITISDNTADLQVISGSAPASAQAGTVITVNWSVKNAGSTLPASPYWADAIYLSPDQTLNNNSILIGYARNPTNLAPGQSYSTSLEVTVPQYLVGDYNVIVYADVDNYAAEPSGLRANNVYPITPPLVITPAPVPNLVVTNIIAPSSAYEGQPVTLTWTVENTGNAPAVGPWEDVAFLSLDQFLDPVSDTYLGATNSLSNLDPGQSYTNTQSFVIPEGLSGPFYVFIDADFNHAVYQAAGTNGNIADAPQVMQINLLPPVNLVVGGITIPTNALPGQNMTITYSVMNTGSNTAIGSWEDAIYISATTNWTINDPLFATVLHTGNVPPGGGYTNTVTAPTPGVLPGDYYVIVRSDILNHLDEPSRATSVATSGSEFDTTIEQLTLGDPVTGTLVQGVPLYFSFDATNGQTIHIQLTTGAPLADNELFVKYGQIASSGDFDYADNDPFVSDPEIYIPITNSGTYYVTADSQYLPAPINYTLLAESLPFIVSEVDPNYAGDQGTTTFEISGASFDTNTLFQVESGTNVLTAVDVSLNNSSDAYVTFDFLGATNLSWDLQAITAGGAVTSTLTNAITLSPGDGAQVDVSIYGQASDVNYNYVQAVTLFYGNSGGNDTPPPLILYDGLDGTEIGTTAQSLTSQEIEILGRPLTGPPNVLRPESSDSIGLYYYGGSLLIQAGYYTADDADLMTPDDWQTVEASVRPAGVPDSVWEPFWGNIQPLVGTTWGDYVTFLDNLALNFPPQECLVSSMIGYMLTNQPGFQASSSASGVLLGATDNQPQANVEVDLVTINPSGLVTVGGRAVTDSSGHFTFSYLQPADYLCAITNSSFDMNQDGVADTNPPSINITGTSNVTGLTLYLYQPPPVTFVTNDSDAFLLVDSAGTLHAFWTRETSLWHAWNNAGTWLDAAPLTTNSVSTYAVAACSNLIDGVTPGILAVWSEGGGQGIDLAYSVGMSGANGVVWSQPAILTPDNYQNTSPSIAFEADGTAVISYLKQSMDYQDDSDVYFSTLKISSTQLNNEAPETVSASGLSPFIPKGPLTYSNTVSVSNSDALSFGYFNQWSCDCFGYDLSLGYNFAAQGSVQGCVASAQGTVGVKGTVDSPNYGLAVTGDVTGVYNWEMNPKQCAFQFKDADLNAGVGATFTVKNGVAFVLGRIPTPLTIAAAQGINTATDVLRTRFKVILENSVNFNIGARFAGLTWDNNDAPITSFSLPDKVDKAEITVGPSFEIAIRGFGKGDATESTLGAFTSRANANQQGAGISLGARALATFEVYPNLYLKSVASLGEFKIIIPPAVNYTYSLNGPQINFAPPKAKFTRHDGQSGSSLLGPGWVYSFDPTSEIGTGNVYGPNAVLANVAADVLPDGAPSLAVDANGTIFQAWYKIEDPTTNIFGSQIYVADYNGTNWNPPVIIPQSGGLNTYVSAATDPLNQRIVVWSHADSTGLGSNMTETQYLTARQAADVYYSTFNGSVWSAPQLVASTPGPDADVQLSYSPKGNVVAIWDYTDANGLDHLVTSSWNGTSWSALEEITTGSISQPSIQQANGSTYVVWTQIIDTNNDTALFEVDNSSGSWGSAAQFGPTVNSPSIKKPNDYLQPEAFQNLTPLYDISPAQHNACCVCASVTSSYTGVNAGCSYRLLSYTNCHRIFVYKACPIGPRDPNDIIGPDGYGPQQWVSASSPLDYTIQFQNDPSRATAPAQQVNITLDLNSNFDARTFRLGDFAFGGQIYTVPTNSAFYQTQIDLTATLGYYVDVFAGVNIASNQAFWTFTTIDPATGSIPANPQLGFLPPDVTPPQGEGYVTYSVLPAASVPTGTEVTAQAEVVFDNQAPLATTVASNTVEAGAPSSSVLPLPPYETTALFNVAWMGVNVPGGVGIASYDIYVSQDGEPYSPWLLNTTLTNATFPAVPGNSYSFYSIATDNSGNVQPTPTQPNTTTFVSTNLPPVLSPIPSITVAPDATATIPFNAYDPNGAELTFSLVSGPTNAAVTFDGTNAVFTWNPTRAYADTTNTFVVSVTDNGTPPLSTNATFTVIVLDYLQLNFGFTNVLAGQSASLPVAVDSSSGVTNLVFNLQIAPGYLTNLSITAVAPEISSATLQGGPSNALVTVQTTPGQMLVGSEPLLLLNFVADTNGGSAFVNVSATNMMASKPTGASYVNYIVQHGTVALVQNQALLLAVSPTNDDRYLTLYGKLGASYELQYTTNLNEAGWMPLVDYVQTNTAVTLSLVPTNAIIFYRLEEK